MFQYSSYLFDVHISDIFTPLCVGGAVCIPSDDDRYKYVRTFFRFDFFLVSTFCHSDIISAAQNL